MSQTLAAPTSSLDRLNAAIARMVVHHGFESFKGDTAGFFSQRPERRPAHRDPQRNLEVLDACVILPELSPVAGRINAWVAGAEASPALLRRFGAARAPAVIFLRNGEYLGAPTASATGANTRPR